MWTLVCSCGEGSLKGFELLNSSALSALALVLVGAVNEDGCVFCLLLVDCLICMIPSGAT